MNICPNRSNPKVAQEFDELVQVLGDEKLAYDFWDLNGGFGVDRCRDGSTSAYFKKMIDSGITREIAIRARYAAYIHQRDINKAVAAYDPRVTDKALNLNRARAINELREAGLLNEKRNEKLIIDKDYTTKRYFNKETGEFRPSVLLDARTGEYWSKVDHILMQHGLTAELINHNELIIPQRVIVDPEIDRGTTDYEFTHKLCKFLSTKTGVNYIVCKDRDDFIAKTKDAGIYQGSNPKVSALYAVQDNTVYVIQGITSMHATIEEFMHAIVAALQCCNSNVFDQLLKEILADKNLETIKAIEQVNITYAEFPKDTINNEIISHVLANYLNNNLFKQYGIHWSKAINDLSETAFRYIGNQYKEYLMDEYNLTEEDFNNDKSLEFNIFDKNIKLNNIHDIINLFNTHGVRLVGLKDTTIKGIYIKNKYHLMYGKDRLNKLPNAYYNLYNTEMSRFNLTDKISKYYQDLFKRYRMDNNKSVDDSKRENEIKKAIIELRGKNNLESLRIFLQDAFQQIGITNIYNANPNCVIRVLQKYKADDYKNMPLQEIQSLYSLIYDTYKQIYDTINGGISNQQLEQYSFYDDNGNFVSNMKEALNRVNESLDEVYKALTQAQFAAAERFADEIINETAGKTNMLDKDGKPVYLGMNAEKFSRYRDQMIDWFMYNYFNHDITMFDYFRNFDASSNVATANIVYLIQRQKALASENAYNRIIKIMNLYKKLRPHMSVGNWQKSIMEFDKDGYPTGYFKSNYNYGQCEQDMQEEINVYVENWKNTHGYSYQVNQYDQSVDYNSLTGEPFYNEKWEKDSSDNYVEPDWVNFQIGIEKIKQKYIVRRYTSKYYQERLSKPYVEGDPNPGHGLSPRTIYLYDQAQSQVNYFLDKCYDEKDGFSHPERLSEADQLQLDIYQQKLDDLADQFDENGNLKSKEDVQVAKEIQAWKAYCQSCMGIDIYRAKFEDRKQQLSDRLNAAIQSGNQDEIDEATKAINTFYKYNAKYSIAPEYFEQAFSARQQSNDKTSNILRQIRRSMNHLVQDKSNGLTMDLSRFYEKPQYFIEIMKYDTLIAQADFDEKVALDADFDDNSFGFKDWFTSIPVYYRTKNGDYVDGYTGKTSPNVAWNSIPLKAQLLEDWSKKLSDDNGTHTMDGLTYKDANGNEHLIDFSGKTYKEIYKWLDDNIFTYQKTVIDKDPQTGKYLRDQNGNYITETIRQNISCLSVLIPSKNKVPGSNIPSVTWNPVGRTYTDKYNKNNGGLIDSRFDHSVKTSYHPDYSKYGVDLNFSPEQIYLMEALQNEIKRCFKEMGFEGIYDNRVPQFEANGSAMISRWAKAPKQSILKFIDNYFTGQRQDSDVRDVRDLPVDFTGNRKYTLATRFMNKLQDTKHLSTDLVAGVMQMIIEAENYKAFKAIENEINLADRIMNKQARGGEQSTKKSQQSRSYTQFRKMIQTMYYQESGLGNDSDQPMSPKVRRVWTAIGLLVGSLSLGMLGYNVPSAVAGLVGSTIYYFSYFGGQSGQLNKTDILYSFLRATPSLLYSLFNCGTILPSSKIPALMYLNDLSKSKREGFRGTYKSRVRKIASKLAMTIFEVCDIIGNSFLTVSMYKNYRLIDGLQSYGITPGFYSLEELKNVAKQIGVKKSVILKAYMISARNKTLFNAYNFSHRDKSLNIEDWAKKYVTPRLKENIRSRLNDAAALINGLGNTDIPSQYEKNIFMRLFTGMRKWVPNTHQEIIGGNNTYRHTAEKKKKDDNITSQGRVVKPNNEQQSKEYAEMTNEDRYYRGHFNPATGREDTALWKNIGYGIQTFYYKIKQAFIQDKNSKMKPKFSKGQKRAFATILSAMATYCVMLFMQPLVSQWAHYPQYQNKSAIQDGMNGSEQQIAIKYSTGLANTPSEYFSKGVYRMTAYNAYERATTDYFNRYIPGYAAFEFFSVPIVQISQLKNAGNVGFNDCAAVIFDSALQFWGSTKASDVYNIDVKEDKVRSGSYKGWPRKVANYQKFAGLPRNIHTSTSNQSIENNTSFYRDKLGSVGQSSNSFRSTDIFGHHIPLKDYWYNYGPYKYDPNKTKGFKSPYSGSSNIGFAAPPPPPPAPTPAPPPPPPAP